MDISRKAGMVVSGITVLIVDSDRNRGSAVHRVLASMPPLRILATAVNMSEGHMIAEAQLPVVILISSDLAARPEFEMFFALTQMIEAICMIYGQASDFADPSARCLPMRGDEDARRIGQRLLAGQAVLAARASSVAPKVDPRMMVVIGASTGGITAIEEILMDFPEDCPPTAIVQHIRGDFAQGFIDRLNRNCRARVSAAEDGAPMRAGQIYVATGNAQHLELASHNGPRCRLVTAPPVSGHRPSVDRLFASAAQFAPNLTAVLLTGMGRDGAEGMLEIRKAGGITLAQSRETCIVFGMPRAALELGAAQAEVPIGRLARSILDASADRPRATLAPSSGFGAWGRHA